LSDAATLRGDAFDHRRWVATVVVAVRASSPTRGRDRGSDDAGRRRRRRRVSDALV